MDKTERIDVSDFKSIFGISMNKVSERLSVTRESVSMVFRGLPASDRLLERLGIALNEIANENYRNDIEIAKYRRARAEKIIKYVFFRMKGE